MQPAPVAAGMQRHSMRATEREPEPVAAAVAFISTADATGVGDK